MRACTSGPVGYTCPSGAIVSQAIVTIGTFDGVHRGHQALLSTVRRHAATAGRSSIAYTFGRPPRTLSRTDPGRTLLLPEHLKHRILLDYVDAIECAEFPQVSRMPPEQFAEQILLRKLDTHTLVVGEGFRFGQGREGSTETLLALGKDRGFSLVTVPSVSAHGAIVSSTRIRRMVADGRAEDASELLGRPHLVFGRVESGDRIGRTLGYPTANLHLDPYVLPPGAGIYYVHAFYGNTRSHALLYVGTRPTIGGNTLRCEVHLLSNPQGNLCGHHLEVHVLKRLRPDRAFPSLDALRGQIARDVTQATDMAVSHPLTRHPISG